MAKINDDKVIYNKQPAVDASRDTSVVGNGRVWASLLGRKGREEITIYRNDLSHGGYTGVLQDVSDKFPTVRKLYADGKIMDAEKLLSAEFAKKGYHPQVGKPLPLPVLCLDFAVEGFITDYKRTTDMASGEAEVAFRHGNSWQARKAFVAVANDVFLYNVTGNAKINMTVCLKNTELQNSVVSYNGDYIYFASRSDEGQDYGMVIRIASNGTQARPNEIAVKDADSVTLYVKTFNNSNRDTEFKKIKAELESMKTYDKAFSQSAAQHEKLFNSCNLTLGGVDSKGGDLSAMLSAVGDADLDAGLVVRLWNLGKYLTICGVNTGGISFFNTAQLRYGGSMSGILPDSVLNFFEQYEKYADDLKKNAGRVYGMRGYFVPNAVSPDSALFGAVDSGTIHFIASSALAANVFYRYYLMTGDLKTLKSRIFPFMKEVCNFYSDYLKLDSYGYYTTVPSYSPQSTPGNTIAGKPLENFGFAVNSTIDFLAVECLLDNLIEAASVVGSTGDIAMWKDMKTKLPLLGVNDAGCLREYINCAFIDRTRNLGTMHAYGLWPLKNISFSDKTVTYKPAIAVGSAARVQDISLRQASFNAIAARLSASWGLQNACSTAVCILQAVHSGLGDITKNTVEELMLRFLSSVCSDSGLCISTDWRGSGFTSAIGGEFDAAANIGFANAVTECILQSNSNTLRILPVALGIFASGSIEDVTADFAAKVSVDWDMKRGKCTVKIMPKVSCVINIEVPKKFNKMKGRELTVGNNVNGLKNVELTAGKLTVLDFA